MNIQTILRTNYPGTIWNLTGEDYSGLEWLDESAKPTENELLDAWPETQLKVARKAVEDTRRTQYQLISDPLYFGWQRGDNTEAEWLAAVDKIKTDNPYPEVAN